MLQGPIFSAVYLFLLKISCFAFLVGIIICYDCNKLICFWMYVFFIWKQIYFTSLHFTSSWNDLVCISCPWKQISCSTTLETVFVFLIKWMLSFWSSREASVFISLFSRNATFEAWKRWTYDKPHYFRLLYLCNYVCFFRNPIKVRQKSGK